MPKILSYTPAWLSRPSPGFSLFSTDGKKLAVDADKCSDQKSRNGTSRKEDWQGPHRTLARRGTEVFVVVGNTIRWADLRKLKEWEALEQDERRVVRSIERTEEREHNGLGSSSYRVGAPTFCSYKADRPSRCSRFPSTNQFASSCHRQTESS